MELGRTAGHVSTRIPGTDEMLLRCRGRGGAGLDATDVHHIRRLDFDGEGPGLGDGYAAPHETPLHGEIYRARPEVQAVVHVHPMFALLCGVVGVEFLPVFAGYNPGLLRIVLDGVPIYKRAATVVDLEMAAGMIEVMGERDIVLLRGHGIVVTGTSVEAATSTALRFEELAYLMWQITLSGRAPIQISEKDIARYDRHSEQRPPWPASRDWQALGGGEGMGWRRYVAKLEREVGLPAEEADGSP